MPGQPTLCCIHNQEDSMKKTNLKVILLGILVNTSWYIYLGIYTLVYTSYYQGKKIPYNTCTDDATRPLYGICHECRFLSFLSSFNIISLVLFNSHRCIHICNILSFTFFHNPSVCFCNLVICEDNLG